MHIAIVAILVALGLLIKISKFMSPRSCGSRSLVLAAAPEPPKPRRLFLKSLAGVAGVAALGGAGKLYSDQQDAIVEATRLKQEAANARRVAEAEKRDTFNREMAASREASKRQAEQRASQRKAANDRRHDSDRDSRCFRRIGGHNVYISSIPGCRD